MRTRLLLIEREHFIHAQEFTLSGFHNTVSKPDLNSICVMRFVGTLAAFCTSPSWKFAGLILTNIRIASIGGDTAKVVRIRIEVDYIAGIVSLLIHYLQCMSALIHPHNYNSQFL